MAKNRKLKQLISTKWPLLSLVSVMLLVFGSAVVFGLVATDNNQAPASHKTTTTSTTKTTSPIQLSQPSQTQPSSSDQGSGGDQTPSSNKSYTIPPNSKNSTYTPPTPQTQSVSYCNKSLAASYAAKRNADIGSENYYHNIQVTTITSYYQASGLSGSPQLDSAIRTENDRHNNALVQIDQIYQSKLDAIECT